MKRILICLFIILMMGIGSCNLWPSESSTDEEIDQSVEVAPVEGSGLQHPETTVVESPQMLMEELPEEVWLSIQSNFEFEPEVTQIMGRMSTDILSLLPHDDYEMTWFAFSHPDSVDTAYGDLFMPPEADSIPPYDTPVDYILRLFLYSWEPEIKTVRGIDWIGEAEEKADEWKGLLQRQADFRFVEGSYEEAPVIVDDIENEEPYKIWTITVTSPIIDLDELVLIEGTFLVITRFQPNYFPQAIVIEEEIGVEEEVEVEIVEEVEVEEVKGPHAWVKETVYWALWTDHNFELDAYTCNLPENEWSGTVTLSGDNGSESSNISFVTDTETMVRFGEEPEQDNEGAWHGMIWEYFVDFVQNGNGEDHLLFNGDVFLWWLDPDPDVVESTFSVPVQYGEDDRCSP